MELPFDGIVAKCVHEELNRLLAGGRIEKIFQPENDEICISVRNWSKSFRLLLSASASYPRIHITNNSKDNPAVPPVFCMLLRKHLTGGKILSFEFSGYERTICMLVESSNELCDISIKKLIIEIMGKHSNIILVNAENKIIDAIKHVDSDISSVREIMPARPYTPPPGQDKTPPDDIDILHFIEEMKNSPLPVEKYLLDNIKGFSPLLCREICYRAGLESREAACSLNHSQASRLQSALGRVIDDITGSRFMPFVAYEDDSLTRPLDFHCIKMEQFRHVKKYSSVNTMLDEFYFARDMSERLRQKRSGLLKNINTYIDRCRKKLAIQEEALRESAGREKLRLFGELITANIYRIPKGAESVSLQNYYSDDNETVEVPLDVNLSPQANAQRYFKKYAKAKSTYANVSSQIEETRRELDYLDSVLQALENCTNPQDIDEIRQELAEQGYLALKDKQQGRKAEKKHNEKGSEPLHFKSSDGYDIFVGKNNRQNDYLTLKKAASNDIWLHTKNIPGSHVIIKKKQGDIPDTTLLEAASLAAWFSKAKMSSNVPVDYTTVRNVSKPSGAKPGMVIYVNYRTITVNPDKELVNKLSLE